jgi:hypothetical protein
VNLDVLAMSRKPIPNLPILVVGSIVLHQEDFARKVAIARFTNETRYGQSFFIDKEENRIGKQAALSRIDIPESPTLLCVY